MKLITREQIAKQFPERWIRQYTHDKDCMAAEALRLPELTPAALDELTDRKIGNTSWTNLKCDECKNLRCEMIVEIGDGRNYESSTVHLCQSCIRKAFELLPSMSKEE